MLGFPLAVLYKFIDDQGIYLAALITYYGFLSLFPLLLLLASALGFALRNDEELRQQILDSTLSQFPVIGEQLRDPQGLQGAHGHRHRRPHRHLRRTRRRPGAAARDEHRVGRAPEPATERVEGPPPQRAAAHAAASPS